MPAAPPLRSGEAPPPTAASSPGQNLDQHESNRDLLIMLHVEPDDGPAMLMCSFAGLVGYPGINAAGVSLFQNALSTPVWRGSAMPHYFLKRVLLEQDEHCRLPGSGAACRGLLLDQLRPHRPGRRARSRNDAGRLRDDRAAGRHPRPHQPLPQSGARPARGAPPQSSRFGQPRAAHGDASRRRIAAVSPSRS